MAASGIDAAAIDVATISLVREKVGLNELNIPVSDEDGSAVLSLLAPKDEQALLELYMENESKFVGLPLWGAVWPAALALTRHANIGQLCTGATCMELGCGLGLAGIAAAVTGKPRSMLLTDYDPVAVEMSVLNAERCGVREVCSGAALDWLKLDAWPESEFDLVIGADILYEPEMLGPLTAVLTRTIKPGGLFLLADGQWRKQRDEMYERLLASGAFRREADDEIVTVSNIDNCMPMDTLGTQQVVLARFTRIV